MIPQTTTKLDEENVKWMQKMIDLLDEDEDVQNVWHNLDEVELFYNKKTI